VEIPRGSRNKYEFDHEKHVFRGVFWMTDDAGPDAKILCVPAGDPRWKGMVDLQDLPEHLPDEIRHFFEVYKVLEPGKHSSVRGWEGVAAAEAEIEACRKRYLG
jgi:inorganic pyrophosphatase